MDIDKLMRRAYDKERRSKMTTTQKRRIETLRSERRKRKREIVPDIQLATSQSTSGLLRANTTCVEKYEVKVMPPCTFCGAKRFEHEPPSFCCSVGKVKLAPTEIPPQLRALYDCTDPDSSEFITHIRAYNSIFSFTSFGVRIHKDLASSRQGVYTFKAQGQAYHNIPSLLPGETGPCFFQLYFLDTDNEVANRLSKVPDATLSQSLVKKIMDILTINPYAAVLKRLKDVPLPSCQLLIRSDPQLDQRVYNCPSANDVAAIWVEGSNPNVASKRDIVVTAQTGKLHRVQHYFGCYDPLQFPLLFPHGDNGWNQQILQAPATTTEQLATSRVPTHLQSADSIFQDEQTGLSRPNNKTVTCRQYYCYKLQIRDDGSILLRAGRLLLQFVVDMYIKLESTRLDYCRQQQTKLRAELYQGIVDSVNVGQRKASMVGKRIVLPASFIGGQRYMRKRYLDAMALVEHYGKPDFFITMTCNPDWVGITRELLPGQRAQDRPDLTCRIFRAKLQDLKDQLFNKNIFGRVAAHVHVIEFQKRGLPHAHLLLIMKAAYKITHPDQYDKFVCAEIPDVESNPDLHRKVVKHMMHGPCGTLKPNNSCMRNGTCKYHYPRAFSDHTVQGKDSYPIYRRRCLNNKVLVRNELLDNSWVVPYNPYLLSRYDCHINVEICSTVKAVKYLYKYLYKGHDKIAFDIFTHDDNNTIDEIRLFQEGRCVTSQEAIWRIFEFELNDITPSVYQLQLHLPYMHPVSFQEHDDLGRVIRSDISTKTMLTEYFTRCAHDPTARQYLYKEFPQHYVWERKQRSWKKRESGFSIGRVCNANPSEGERYYLRLLLNNVRGPTSFTDLMTVSGVQYHSFKEAADKLGLLASDDYASLCLREASSFQLPEALRRLFASVLLFLEPRNVMQLWEEHFESLSEDFLVLQKKSPSAAKSLTLSQIAFYLESMGSSISKYDLPAIVMDQNQTRRIANRVIEDELAVINPKEDAALLEKLNQQQKFCYDTIISRVYSGKSGAFFVDGPGGTGKTYLYRALLWVVRSRKDIALATASSGVAAANLPGGRTAHSRFGIPFTCDESSVCNINKQSATAKLIRRAKLIIWDEAPMSKRVTFEALDRSLQDIMSSTEIFGGKVIVFCGDFRQVLPVVPRGTRGQVVNACLARSYFWPQLEKLQLTENMRAKSDPVFSDFLLRVGNGDEPTTADDMIRIPETMILQCPVDKDPVLTLINHIYPSLHSAECPSSYIADRAILATTNNSVDMLNEKIISMFPGDACTYRSFDEAIDDTHNFYPEDFLNSLMPSGFPPHLLVLKVNSPIMLLRNIDPANGLCNGTRLVCRRFEPNVIHAEISVGHHAGKAVFIHRIQFIPNETEEFPFRFKRSQFPVRLAFSMTVNKAQGQTLPHVGVYLPSGVFSHGQLYVALSRGTSMLTTKILLQSVPTEPVLSNVSHTKNIVYKEVLSP